MASYINTNIASLNAQNNLTKSQSALATSLQRLSSGMRINSAKDDAAGLAITQRMTSQINGSDQASRNANDGISLTQTAEGDLSTISDNLQSMRALAVQAANGSNSASDRASINNQVQALSAEIDRVSQSSSFNGNKLLDGSFTSQSFQVGANSTSTDSIAIAIGSARTSALGGVGTSFAAKTTGTATTAALNAGDLTLNGFQVGASALGAQPGQGTASASSIATAINAISANSGVTATANSNNLSATATTFNAVAANSFSVNGINVGAIAAGTTAAGQGANVAAAINAVGTQSGVTATADATTGAVTLKASDGRDINIATNAAAASTVAGALTASNALKANIGFSVGTGATNATAGAAVAGTASAVAATYTLAAAQTSIAANTITITSGGNSYQLGAVDLTGSAAQNATNLSTAINAATGQATTTNGTATKVTTAIAYTLSVSGTAADTTTASANQAAATAQFGTSSAAGVIGTQAYGGPAAGVATSTHGTISLSSTSSAGIVWAGAAAASAGMAASGSQTAAVTSSVSSIASIDVSTAAGASSALAAIDGALATVNASRASLGAYQNRFASVVSNLQSTTENITASRSRIQDTDFASETASLTRGQILQQAGTAMLAQANSLPNGVMALLR